MYSNPLAIFREYIQNSVDALVAVNPSSRGKIYIKLDPSQLRINIRDNGPGLSYSDAVRSLIPISKSEKNREVSRGFRGIGRLSGLAFAESVTFLTRTQRCLSVTRVIWDGVKLRNQLLETTDSEQVIKNCVTIDTLEDDQYPENFFEVVITGVSRHAAGLLLNREAIQSYISEVCPVPMSNSFPFVSEISELCDIDDWLYTVDVYLDDNPNPVTRNYGSTIPFTENRHDEYTNFEEFQFPSVDGKTIAAIGWIAHSSYLGAIPKEAGIRGVRVRDGNIQIGDENVFDHLFLENRFNRWCIGEFYILDSRIVPNGRRDYFEPGPHTRNLENHLRAIIRRITTRCRATSTIRSKEKRLLLTICQLEEIYDLAISGYLLPDDAKALVKNTLQRFPAIQQKYSSSNNELRFGLDKLEMLENQFLEFRVKRGRPSLNGVPSNQIAIYRKVFKVLMEVSSSTRDAKKTIEAVLSSST